MNKNAYKHLRTVLIHKYWVGYYCFKCRLYAQGILHDLSKLSPSEFVESSRYYQGHRSPIDACKEANGYSKAWLHHKGRNKHHFEYWIHNFSSPENVESIQMPFKYALEMMCDYLGAGRAYYGESFTIRKEYDWWLDKKTKAMINPHTMGMIDEMFEQMLKRGIDEVLTDRKYLRKLKKRYNSCQLAL